MKNVFDRIVSRAEESDEPLQDSSHPSSENFNPQDALESVSATTSAEVKAVVQELLRSGFLEEAQRPEQFRHAVVHAAAINAVLEPLDLFLRMDSYRGIAYLAVSQTVRESSPNEDGWSHPLVRRQRLTLEQSLLLAILRQAFVLHEQESGVGQSAAKIAIEDVLPQFLIYFGDSGSDAKNESRLMNLLDQLKTYGVVSEVDQNQMVTIRPLIAHLASPESLFALLQVLNEQRTLRNATGGSDPC